MDERQNTHTGFFVVPTSGEEDYEFHDAMSKRNHSAAGIEERNENTVNFSETFLSETSPLRENCSNTFTAATERRLPKTGDSAKMEGTKATTTAEEKPNTNEGASESYSTPTKVVTPRFGGEGLSATKEQNGTNLATSGAKGFGGEHGANDKQPGAEATIEAVPNQRSAFVPVAKELAGKNNWPPKQSTPTKPPLARKSPTGKATTDAAANNDSPASVRSIFTSSAATVDLDDTIETSSVDFSTASSTTTTKESFIAIIESAMENVQFDCESNLAKIWAAACDEKKDISMEEALTAAVTDLLNLQTTLHKTERELAMYKAAAALPTDEEKYQMKIKALEVELEASQKVVSVQNNQKQRMVANMKKKKNTIAALETKVEAHEKDLSSLTAENCELRRGLAAVCEVRDNYKARLRCQEDRAKETRMTIQDLQKRLRRIGQYRALEGELLEHFRKLSNHTGLSRWGKSVSLFRLGQFCSFLAHHSHRI